MDHCEACPLRSFCVEFIQTSTEDVEHNKAELVDIRSELTNIEDLGLQGEELLRVKIRRLEERGIYADEEFSAVVEEYVQTEVDQARFHQRVARIGDFMNKLVELHS